MTSTPDAGLLRAIDDTIFARRDDLIEATQALARFETVSVDLSPGSEHQHNDEASLQAWVADRLGAMGCRIDQWEPDPADLLGTR